MVGKKISLLLSLILIVSTIVGCTSGNDTYTIGVTQIVEHPALDSSREGFMQALADNGYVEGENIVVDYKNAQGDINTANTIANGFVSDSVDMIFAIATPTAQAAYNATKDIPILITAVTDPVTAGLAQSMEQSGTNVTGTSDMTPIDKQFELLVQLVPEAKKVGIVYNTGESNSEIQVAMAEEEASKLGLELVKKGVTDVNEVAQALESFVNDIDVLYVPTDNMIVSAMPLITARTLEASVPVIGSEEGQVEQGAIATEGINYYELGYQTGVMAVKVIKGEEPGNISLETLENTELVINKTSVDQLGMTIPAELVQDAKTLD
ncbi:ABC transporter substrate-binding protein [Vallitalea okinawensis]|uniref:ABC transporter substrate-binding protein n=1 Tax=Vallitalea okinawensis TaxID=2078660 RepID=UPI000CFE02EE|nr:ABC transporter substrate-binding protein [Vallitalea okinawensis]